MLIEITGYERRHRLASTTTMQQADISYTLTFEPAASGTRMRWSGNVRPKGATLVVAALFSPVRRRVQHVVDHRFNRTRYDAELMTAAFAARLQDATDLDAVQADLAATADRALQPAHLSLWLAS